MLTTASPRSATSTAPAFSAYASRCAHCGNPLRLTAESEAFCCPGCRAVHALLNDAGLQRYYELRDDVITPPTAGGPLTRRDRNWLEPIAARLAAAGEPIELTFKLQGLRCAACV